jgi:hypothetical protein
MKVLFLALGLFWLVGSAFGQNQIPSSRSPGDDRNGLDSQVGGDKKIAKHARRAFGKMQNKGRDALYDFNHELEQKQIYYHRRMIYQIRQARKLESRHRKRRYANPNYCYVPRIFGRKKKR